MFEVKENAFYTVRDLNEGLKVNIYTLRNWIKSGQLKASKVGRNYMINGDNLKEFLNKGTVASEKAK